MKAQENPQKTLAQLVLKAEHWFNQSLLNVIKNEEYGDLSNAHLILLAHLNCGETYSSDLAKRMGISRQAVYKSLRDLREFGIVELSDVPGQGKVKIISFTGRGERLIQRCVQTLDDIEAHLAKQISATSVKNLRYVLEKDWGSPFQP